MAWRWMKACLRGGFAMVALLTCLGAAGCARVLRYPVRDIPSAWDAEQRLPRTMNAGILSGLMFDKLIVEVDWVEGYHPAPLAIEFLDRRLKEYLPAGMSYEILLDDVIPRSEWEKIETAGESTTDQLAQKYLDHLPSRESKTEVAYVLYLPRDEYGIGLFGHLTWWVVEREGREEVVEGVSLFSDSFRREARLWVTPRRIDRNTLVHEVGHLLGLVGNPTHEQRGNPNHCTNPRCVMTHPRARSLIYWGTVGLLGVRMPTDYCRYCRGDIRTAQRIWEQAAARDPEYVERLFRWRDAQRLEIIAWNRCEEKNRCETALETMEGGAEIHRRDARYLSVLARFQAMNGKLDRALETYKRVKSLDPLEGADEGIATVLCLQGRYQEAASFLEQQQAAKGPLGFETVQVRVWALAGAGRYREAASVWDAFIRRLPTRKERRRPWLVMSLTRLYRRAGMLDRAQAALERARPRGRRSLDWNLERARLSMARGERAAGREQLASEAEWLSRSLSTQPEERRPAGALVQLAKIYALAGDADAAREAVEEAERAAARTSGPTSRWLTLSLAETLALIGDRDGAFEKLALLQGDYEFLTMGGDECLSEELAPLREEERFQRLFPRCFQGGLQPIGEGE